MFFVIPAFLYMIFAKGYHTKNLGVIINFLLLVIDDISKFMGTLSNIENGFVSFERCQRYLEVQPEDGYKYFKTIEETILNNNQKILNFDKIKEKIELLDQKNVIEDGLNQPLLDEKKYYSITQPKDQFGLDISMKNVKVKYSPELPYVLKGISLDIKPGEKIGIIGRTGAGKTSFVNLFIRFFDDYDGSILLNGRELKSIYLESLRSNVTFITQDSYFFEGSLRENLDPKGITTDERLIQLLQESEMFDKVNLSGGLDWELDGKGGDLSVGEKQIFCFLRAIINTNKLIIMDEATSNMDVKSEDILERLKEKYMTDSTLMIIAHRLNTIHSCDKVLILEDGKVQRFVSRTDLSETELEYFKNYLKMFD
jgi:ABC-type multidrug transport system fused ATPase/permease subunit